MERLLELVISEMLLCIPTQALVEMFTQARLEVGWTREKTIYELLFRMAHFDRWTLKLAMHSLKADLK